MRCRNEGSWFSLARALGASALLAAIGLLPPSSPSAALAAEPDPAVRIMLKTNWIKVHDDSEWGTAELEYKVTLQRTSPSCGGPCADDKFEYTYKFSGDKGTVKSFQGTWDQLVPYYRAQPDGIYAAPQPGLSLFPGDGLRVRWAGNESDPAFDDYLGSFVEDFSQAQGWGQAVVHETSSRDTLGFGGFTVNYEIVRAPLPDLFITDVRVGNFADNGDDIVCVAIENVGPEPAGPYTLRFYVDGSIPRNGEIPEAGVLPAVGHLERCFQTNIAAGQHNFMATVDEDQKVAELSEENNSKGLVATIFRRNVGGVAQPLGPMGVLEPVTDAGPSTNPTPTPQPADLTASNLRVRGKEPEGQNDCDPGRNDVTVVVKNEGGADAAAFAVVLLVEGDQDDGGKKDVQSLVKGAETTVRFEETRLKKGKHELKIRVDSDETIAESSESNNELAQEVRCKEEDD
jgi:hypothetical protein